MSALRDVLADIIRDTVDEVIDTDMALFSDEGCAEDILDTDELQWLRGWAAATNAHHDPTCPPALQDWIEGDVA